MPLVSGNIPNLVGGVSQQPPSLRLRTTCSEMVNALPSVVTGLQKRPPSQHVAKLLSTLVTDAHIHFIDRKGFGQHMVLVTNGDLKVFSLTTGSEETVTYPDGKAYLTTTDPRSNFRCLTVADTTLLLNRSVTTAISSVSETGSGRIDPSTRGTIYVKQGVALINYNVYIDNVLKATFTTKDGTSASTVVDGTDTIASDLSTDLTAAGYTNVLTGSTISVTLGSAEVLIHTDGFADKGMGSYKDAVQKFSDLPPDEVVGRVVKVKGDIDDNADDYFVSYGDGVYTETYGYGEGEELDASTMYHELVNTSTGNWVFRRVSFGSRLAGDSNTNPSPSFVGKTINDLFLYKGRTCLLADENVIMSEVAEYHNFYRTTVVQLVDTDPIDLASTTNRTSIMFNAVPFNESLLLFSDKTQFRLNHGDVLSPSSTSLSETTRFNAATDVQPIKIGPNVIFADDPETGSFAALREYFVEANTEADDAADITIQIPTYIPSGIYRLTASTTEDIMVALSSSTVNSMYVYKYFWGAQGKTQSAWGRWDFPSDCTILDAHFIDNVLYVCSTCVDGTYLDKIDVQQGVVDFGDRFSVLLDRRVTQDECTSVFNSSTNQTTITIPFSVGTSSPAVVTIKDGAAISGLSKTVVSATGNTVVVTGDLTSTKYALGNPYTMTYEFSPFFVREVAGSGEVVVQDGRLQIRNVKVLYDGTATFTATFQPDQRDASVTNFTGRNLGSSNNVIGSLSLETGTFTIPCPGQNNKITVTLTNDKPFPCYFTSAEWSGMYYPKSKRT